MLSSAIFTVLLLLTSCGKEPGPIVEADAPVLKSQSIANGEILSSPKDLTITLSYDQNVRCPLTEQSKVTISGGASVDKVFAASENVLISVSGLQYETSYTLDVPSGVITGFKENQKVPSGVSISFSVDKKPEPIVPDVDPDVIPARGTSLAWQMQELLGLGFNFGNNMDAFRNGDWAGDLRDVPDESCWVPAEITPKYITLEAMKKIKSYGFKSVRIPISWLKKIGPAPDYKIDEAWMNRVAEIVGYAETAGLYCIINTHHDENHPSDDHAADTEWHWLDIKGALHDPAKNEKIKDEIKKVWGQIAERFKDKGEFLIMESFNEINDGGWGWSAEFRANPKAQYDILNDWNQVFVDAVRATGGQNSTRWLGIPGYCANPQFTMEGLVLPKDSADGRLMVGVHSYDPFNFNSYSENYKSEWGHTADPAKRCSSDDEREIRLMMAKLYAKYISKGIPVYFGEFGSINRPTAREQAFEKYWFEYFTKCARSFGMSAFLWDSQGLDTYGMGFINHGSGEYIMQGKTMVGAMLKGMNTTSESYTLKTVYDNAPR